MKFLVALALALSLGNIGCQGKKSSSYAGAVDPGANSGDQNPAPGNSEEKQPDLSDAELRKVSLAAFEQTVYPIVKASCGSCHGAAIVPYFAADDMEAAHDTLVNDKKVDLVKGELSRIVQRMAEGHNCIDGDCDKAKATLTSAVNQWIDALKKAGKTTEANDGNKTLDVAINSAAETTERDAGSVGMKAELATNLVAPFAIRKDDVDGDAGSYIMAPTRNNLVVTEAQAGATADFRLSVPAAGTYYMWARVKAPNANANAFNVRVGSSAFTAFNAPVNAAWMWVRLNTAANVAMPFVLQAGDTIVQVKQRKENTKVNQVVLTTTKDGFNGIIDRKVRKLTFDLTALTNTNAKLTVIVEAFGKDGKSYLLRAPHIDTDKAIKVKDLHPVINGVSNSLHTTFTIIDTTVKPPGATLSDSTLVVATDGSFDTDSIAFSFGKIE